jgi:1D-myo-inositol-tetrakisphosphate 5-kinase/inositol-polyphosphate multikinase
MPSFMGILALSPNQTAPVNGVSPAIQVHQELPSAIASHVPAGWLPSNLAPSSLPTPISSKRTSWKPSGGKKLDTPTAIVLENVAAGFSHPNILDVKLGSRLWADDAPEAKRRKLDDVTKQTTSASLGFRIAGMKRWIGQVSNGSSLENKEKGIEYKDEYLCYNKAYGRSFAAHDVKDGFIEYFGGQIDPHNSLSKLKRYKIDKVIGLILRELESIRFTLREEESRMYSASILMIFEGDELAMDAAIQGEKEKSERADIISRLDEGTVTDEEIERLPDTDDEEEELPKLYDIRLIDFAHAQFTPGQGPDNNVLHGVNSLIRIFKELAELAATN